jgi:type VI secretion system protein ImpM
VPGVLTLTAGLFGKLPARGDFVRLGLPRSFTDPWDEWLKQGIAASRQALGEGWMAAWMEAPVWRFALAPGLCGPDAVSGLWLPSVDRVGRCFPLTLAALTPCLDAAWLDGAEALGRAALEEDLPPEAIATGLAALPASDAAAGADAPCLCWTEGAPRVPPCRLAAPALPPAADFAAMLDAGQPHGAWLALEDTR